MKFHTKFRPGDLVKDIKTGDEGIIIQIQAIWNDKDGMIMHCECNDKKHPGAIYLEGSYGIYSKTHNGSLNGWWYKDNQLELVKKGFLH